MSHSVSPNEIHQMNKAYASLMKSWESCEKDCAENEGEISMYRATLASIKPWKIRTFKATNGPVSIGRTLFFRIGRTLFFHINLFAYNLILWLNCDWKMHVWTLRKKKERKRQCLTRRSNNLNDGFIILNSLFSQASLGIHRSGTKT